MRQLSNAQRRDYQVAKQLYLERLKKGLALQAERELKRYLETLLKQLLPLLAKSDITNISQRGFALLLRDFRDIERKARPAFKAAILQLIRDVLEVETELRAEYVEEEADSDIWPIFLATIIGSSGLRPDAYLDRQLNVIRSNFESVLNASRYAKSPLSETTSALEEISGLAGLIAVFNTLIQLAQGTVFSNLGKALKYIWISVLDSRTTDICISLANKVFTRGKGPIPPAHTRCRSTIADYIVGMGSVEDMTLTQWVRTQDKKAVSDMLSDQPLSIAQYKAKVRGLL